MGGLFFGGIFKKEKENTYHIYMNNVPEIIALIRLFWQCSFICVRKDYSY